MNKAIDHQRYFRELPLPAERLAWFAEVAAQSVADQKKIEDSDTISFERYLERLNAEYRELLR